MIIYDLHPENFEEGEQATQLYEMLLSNDPAVIPALRPQMEPLRAEILGRPYPVLSKAHLGTLFRGHVEDFDLKKFRGLNDDSTKRLVTDLAPHLLEIVIDQKLRAPAMITFSGTFLIDFPEKGFAIFLQKEEGEDPRYCFLGDREKAGMWQNVIFTSDVARFYDGWANVVRDRHCCSVEEVRTRHQKWAADLGVTIKQGFWSSLRQRIFS